jgi:hypothetical protein
MRSVRPGSAVAAVGIVVLCEPHMVVTSRDVIVRAKRARVNAGALALAR